ncbi:response regulator [Sphaerospermopsis aphanizomenoides BCCUSP55]|nr:response regulator [Sphaerospermopsis aphanizomenoides BCCUSP55]
MKDSNLILVVDDTTANLEVISEALADAGFEVAIAKDGERAIKQAERTLPGLILLDIMMPGIDGFETCRRLKASDITKHIPVIFMTSLSESTDKITGLNLGAVDYITKPFHEAELIARVKTHLRLYHLNQHLEDQVNQRTAELKAAMLKMQQSQFQLIQSEKMATLGQLVAGVAHEINNPINFIQGNLIHIEEYAQTILDFLELYQKNCPQPIPEIKRKSEEVDLEFMHNDLLKILASMKIGTDRIRQIVLSLRNFSRTDESEFKAVDIHTGIDSTLLILQHRLKAIPTHPAIKIVRDYGKLPEVECYPGLLNQVLMNILANAIDALEEVATQRTYQEMQNNPLTIIIKTLIREKKLVEISITDNGIGIKEEAKKRIFDPFFTTKPVGKGTGLGMSISYHIITEKHGGKIECFTKVGEGTKFVIQIPIQREY